MSRSRPRSSRPTTCRSSSSARCGGPARRLPAQTFILIANTSATAGQAQITVYFEDGSSVARTVQLLAKSRRNVDIGDTFPEAQGRRFSAIVQSLGATPAQIVVERAMYTSPGGAFWAAGTDAVATKLQ